MQAKTFAKLYKLC